MLCFCARVEKKSNSILDQGLELVVFTKNQRDFGRIGKRYENVRGFFNQTSIDLMIHQVNENSRQIVELEKEWMGMNRRLMHLHLVSENNRFNELIRLKSKTKTLQSIDYYLDNPDELLEIIG